MVVAREKKHRKNHCQSYTRNLFGMIFGNQRKVGENLIIYIFFYVRLEGEERKFIYFRLWSAELMRRGLKWRLFSFQMDGRGAFLLIIF